MPALGPFDAEKRLKLPIVTPDPVAGSTVRQSMPKEARGAAFAAAWTSEQGPG